MRTNLVHFDRLIIIFFVALDPASPWFEQTRVEHRVSKTDAEFVDVIHTNSGLLVTVLSIYYIRDTIIAILMVHL